MPQDAKSESSSSFSIRDETRRRREDWEREDRMDDVHRLTVEAINGGEFFSLLSHPSSGQSESEKPSPLKRTRARYTQPNLRDDTRYYLLLHPVHKTRDDARIMRSAYS